MEPTRLAVVLPMYNEEESMKPLMSRIEAAVRSPVTFVIVDDGSDDRSLDVVRQYELTGLDNRRRIVSLSRNFGHQPALVAGLSAVPTDCTHVVTMDADLQDRPEDIPLLVEKLNQGFDCVYAVRKARSGSFITDALTRLFYHIQGMLLSIHIPRHAGTFCIFNRQVLEKLLEFEEHEIYFPGLRAYVGLRQTGVRVTRGERAHGRSKVGFRGLLRLSMSGLLGFSALPMRAIFVFGALTTGLCVLLGLLLFIMKVTGITEIPGVTTVLIFIVGFGGIQIMFTGMVGEYVGKLLMESKRRPRWLVRETIDE